MQTRIPEKLRQTPAGTEAEKILRSCVHCGFCNATCPTYQLLGDELDGPRGRIYQIKQILEENTVTRETQRHLDRCLTCRACETTCPSGVQYGKLLDIGRQMIEKSVPRSTADRLKRRLIKSLLPYPKRYRWAIHIARQLRPLFPTKLHSLLPTHQPSRHTTTPCDTQSFSRRVILVQGCAQSVLGQEINQATVQVLNHLGIAVQTVQKEGCCGAIHHHLGDDSSRFIKQNIDAWWPYIEQGAEAIISTASGCGVHLKEYRTLLPENDPYRHKVERIGSCIVDIGEFLFREDLTALTLKPTPIKNRVAFHAPCTLQHGQQTTGIVETILQQCGFILTPVPEAHLCCGSAGTYSLLQPELSRQLRERKTEALQSACPDLIASANIGCLLHLRQGSDRPVQHWIELVAHRIHFKQHACLENSW